MIHNCDIKCFSIFFPSFVIHKSWCMWFEYDKQYDPCSDNMNKQQDKYLIHESNWVDPQATKHFLCNCTTCNVSLDPVRGFTCLGRTFVCGIKRWKHLFKNVKLTVDLSLKFFFYKNTIQFRNKIVFLGWSLIVLSISQRFSEVFHLKSFGVVATVWFPSGGCQKGEIFFEFEDGTLRREKMGRFVRWLVALFPFVLSFCFPWKMWH